MSFFLDDHYRALANGAGIDPDMRRLLEQQSGSERAREGMLRFRSETLSELDQTRAYQLSRDVVAIALETSRHLVPPYRLVPLVDNTWIEFEDTMIVDEVMAVRAIWFSRHGIYLIQDAHHVRILALEHGIMVCSSGPCGNACSRPSNWSSTIAPGIVEIFVPLDSPVVEDCICSGTAHHWASLVASLLMTLRAEGIDQVVEHRHSHLQARGTRAQRTGHAHVASVTHLHLSRRIVYDHDDDDDDALSADGSPVADGDGDVFTVQVAEYLKELDPARNSRWKQYRIVIVSGYSYQRAGRPRRYLVDL